MRALLPFVVVLGLVAGAGGAVRPSSSPDVAPRQDRPFRHADHGAFDCTRCHGTETSHGTLKVRNRRDCLECHHAPQRATPCSTCHEPARYGATVYSRPATIQVADAPARPRELPFDHSRHTGVDCVTCHVTPVTMDPAPVACTSCHEQHHQPSTQCVQCHLSPPRAAHPREAHVTCAGAACHDARDFGEGERTRSLCLACHRARTNHEPGGVCADCHVLPPWRGAALPFPVR